MVNAHAFPVALVANAGYYSRSWIEFDGLSKRLARFQAPERLCYTMPLECLVYKYYKEILLLLKKGNSKGEDA